MKTDEERLALVLMGGVHLEWGGGSDSLIFYCPICNKHDWGGPIHQSVLDSNTKGVHCVTCRNTFKVLSEPIGTPGGLK